jgi:hypothetical protein
MPNSHVQALANAQAHGEDLHQLRQHYPPPASVHPRRNSDLNARNAAGGARALARLVQQAIIADANGPRNLHGLGKTSPLQQISCATYLSLRTLDSRSSTTTSGCWWSVLPCSSRKAPHHAIGTWPPAQSGVGSQQPNPSVHQQQACPPRRAAMPRLRLALIQHSPRSAHQCVASLGPTMMHAASSTRGN